MNKAYAIDVLKLLKQNYERAWGAMGTSPCEQIKEEIEIDAKAEEKRRQIYIDALSTAINELSKS